jgi:glycosyltransferase involved in cell wall biosynthesis
LLSSLALSRLREAICHRDAVHPEVLHVLSSDQRRGAETFGYDLHQALRSRGLRSEICCLAPGGGERRLPVTALGASRFSLSGLLALRRRAGQVGVVVAHGSSTLLACGAGLVATGVPFVYLSIGDPRYWAGARLRRMRATWMIQRAVAVVAISPTARGVLIRHYGLSPAKVHVIPNGRSAERFAPADRESKIAARQALGLPLGSDVVAVVGALSAEKRVDVAIAAVARQPDLVLAIAGQGRERQALEALARRVAPGRVHFLGATDGSAEVLSAADVLALSSDSEGVPGILIEAGLSGIPVVSTDVGWVSDVVRPDVSGLLVPPGEPEQLGVALRKALDERDRLGRGGRALCLAEFDMAVVSEKWHRLLSAVARR